ncbi:C39 family peptidase [bacterium]|nr:C39 family peptidase [bacterium]
MSIIHMETEATRAAAQKFQNFCEILSSDHQTLLRKVRLLPSSWQGNSQDEFQSEIELVLRSVSQLQIEFDGLSLLLNQEIAQWEEMDDWISGGLFFGFSQYMDRSVPMAGGDGTLASFVPFSILPMFSLASVENLIDRSDLPPWLSNLLGRFLGKTTDAPSAPAESQTDGEQKSAFGELLEDTPLSPQTKMGSEQTELGKLIDGPAYQVPVRSQGALYGNAACSPTSVSMVLDYYHAQNPENASVNPDTLIGLMDNGDGTSGRGISLSNLTDELNDLGYNNISQRVGVTMDNLQSELKNGPVIVTTGVSLVGSSDVPRAITGSGSTIHAMVVTGVSDNIVYVNDPWSGSRLEFSQEQFSTMWSNGQNGYYAIRP